MNEPIATTGKIAPWSASQPTPPITIGWLFSSRERRLLSVTLVYGIALSFAEPVNLLHAYDEAGRYVATYSGKPHQGATCAVQVCGRREIEQELARRIEGPQKALHGANDDEPVGMVPEPQGESPRGFKSAHEDMA